MRKFRYLCLTLAVMLSLSLALPVFAAEVDCDGVYCFGTGDFAQNPEPLAGICITGLPDSDTGTVMLGNRVLNRLTVLLPESGKTITDYGLNPDGTGQVLWPDGSRVWSSVDYVHHKDAHFHTAVANALGLLQWRCAGSEWP